VGGSDSPEGSDSEELDAAGETWDEFVSVEESAELPTSEAKKEASSLSAQVDDELLGLGSLLNEKRKGWTARGSFSRMRFVTGLCSYTQSDP